MNTIGIDRNLDRARIKKLLTIGLFASILTGMVISIFSRISALSTRSPVARRTAS